MRIGRARVASRANDRDPEHPVRDLALLKRIGRKHWLLATPSLHPNAGTFAREIADYFDEKWPELNITTFREALLPSTQVHWVTQYENIEAWAAFRGVLFQDRGYQMLLQKAQGTFVPQSCTDTLFRNLRR